MKKIFVYENVRRLNTVSVLSLFVNIQFLCKVKQEQK